METMPPPLASSFSERIDAALELDIASLSDDEVEVVCGVSPDEAKDLFTILERNMRDMYDASEWGWDGDAKQAELLEERARFVVMRRDDEILGFAQFRFEVDDEDEPERTVLYVRELQCVAPRRGVGRKCMEKMEEIAALARVDAVLLTVFKSNVGALKFYEKVGYAVDSDDPENWGQHACCYRILSKKVRSLRHKRRRLLLRT